MIIDPKMLATMWNDLPKGTEKVDYKLRFKRGSKPVLSQSVKVPAAVEQAL